MDMRLAIIRMLTQLLEDMRAIQQQGAGYYSVVPFAKRYNKLLTEAQKLFSDRNPLIATFDTAEESDPKDPNYKGNVLQGIRVESGQLIALLGALADTKEANA
ncbi:MAG: hypothetical protein AMXMBFR84_10060 [Candidatus Hydrogenedentota bacterium]